MLRIGRRRVIGWGLAGLVAAGVVWAIVSVAGAPRQPDSATLVEQVRTLGPAGADRAARQLAARGAAATPLLAAVAGDTQAGEWGRKAAMSALGRMHGPGVVAALKAGLQDQVTAYRAAAGLTKQGEAGFEALVEALVDPESVAGEAASALGRLGDRRAVPALAQAYRRGVSSAGWALAQLGDEGAAVVLPALSSPSPLERSEAARMLGFAKGPTVVRALARALNDAKPQVREAAAEALARLGAREALFAALRSGRPEVRLAAVRGVGALRSSGEGDEGTSRLLAMLGDRQLAIREAAAGALAGRAAEPRVEKALVGLLHSSNEALRRSAAHGLVAGGRLAALAPALLADQQVVAALPSLARDLGGGEARVFGAVLLRRARGTPAVAQLAKLLRDPRRRDQAAGALGETADPAAVPALIEALGSPPRRGAITALSRIADPRAVGPLLNLVRTVTGDDQQAAVYALGSLHDARAVEPLLPLLGSDDAELRHAALTALCSLKGQLGAHRPTVIAALRQALARGPREDQRLGFVVARLGAEGAAVAAEVLQEAKDPEVRGQLCGMLSETATPAEASVLLGQLDESPRSCRRLLAMALGRTGDRRAIEPLVALLDDPDPLVQGAAARALGQIGDAQATPALLAALESLAPVTRQGAAEGLGALRAKEAAPRLRAILTTGIAPRDGAWIGEYQELPSDTVREAEAAARALGEIGDEQAVPLLLKALRAGGRFDQHSVPAAAAAALGHFDRPEVRDALLAALNGRPYHADTEALAEALGRLRERRAVTALLRLLDDYGSELQGRRAAATALGQIGDRQAVPRLISHLDDPWTANEVAGSLTALTGQRLGTDSWRWRAWWKGQNKRRAG